MTEAAWLINSDSEAAQMMPLHGLTRIIWGMTPKGLLSLGVSDCTEALLLFSNSS